MTDATPHLETDPLKLPPVAAALAMLRHVKEANPGRDDIHDWIEVAMGGRQWLDFKWCLNALHARNSFAESAKFCDLKFFLDHRLQPKTFCIAVADPKSA